MSVDLNAIPGTLTIPCFPSQSVSIELFLVDEDGVAIDVTTILEVAMQVKDSADGEEVLAGNATSFTPSTNAVPMTLAIPAEAVPGTYTADCVVRLTGPKYVKTRKFNVVLESAITELAEAAP